MINIEEEQIMPRLSDEDIDPLEKDDVRDSNFSDILEPGWKPWSDEDKMDIRKIIDTKLDPKSQFVFEAYLDGMTYRDMSVSEKYWRYHFNKGLKIIKEELGL